MAKKQRSHDEQYLLIGAATVAHQVEGNNTNSDIWAMEHMKFGGCVRVATRGGGVRTCVADGIDVAGYMYWSLIDNYEWQSGYAMQFGLMGREEGHPAKPSLAFLGDVEFAADGTIGLG